jgi:hypothetical protein
MAGSETGFIFNHAGAGSFNGTQAVFQITKNFTNAEAVTVLDKLFEINGTYNFTNGTKGLIGINYNPTITALSGAHYGLLIRPSGTLNGIGLGSTLPTATWHIKGNSDSVGNIFTAENLSNTSYFTFSNSGLLTTNQPGGGSNYTVLNILRGGSSWMTFGSGGGEEGISKTGNFFLKSTSNVVLQGVNTSTTPISFLNASTVGSNGAIGNAASYYAFTNLGVIAHSAGGSPVESTILKINNNISVANGSDNSFVNIFESRPTINQTSGNINIVGYTYNPTITAITGSHYGLLIRPSTLNGFGLGNTLPSASLHIRGGLTGSVLQLESNTSSSILVINNNGTGSYNGFLTTTGSLLGTASFANNALSSSFASTSSIATSSSYALSSSFALTASYVANASSFPFTGSAIITGSLIVTGSVAVTQNITGSRLFLSSSNGTVSGSTLTVYGSGSAQPVFTVQGSQGELFSITDSLTGSLFSVNDISGLPILEVFSDNTTLIGNYQDPMLITTAKVVQTNSGSFTVYSLPTASYDTAFFEYSVRSGSNARAGNIMAIQSGSSVNFTETTTTDFGNTSAISFTVIVSGSNIALTGSSTTGSWTIKAIVKGI